MSGYIARVLFLVAVLLAWLVIFIACGKPAPRTVAPAAVTTLVFPPKDGTYLILPGKVIDGDTIEFYWLVKDRARLYGMNAPEVTGKEKAQGAKSKAYLEKLLPRSPTTAKIEGRDKYGRQLLSIYDLQGNSVSTLMIEAGMAKPWNGQRKKP